MERSPKQTFGEGEQIDPGAIPPTHRFFVEAPSIRSPCPDDWGFNTTRVGQICSASALSTRIDEVELDKSFHGQLQLIQDETGRAVGASPYDWDGENKMYGFRDDCLSHKPEEVLRMEGDEWDKWMDDMINYLIYRHVIKGITIPVCDAPASLVGLGGGRTTIIDAWGRGE